MINRTPATLFEERQPMRRLLFVCALALALLAGRPRADEDKPKERPKEKAKPTPTLDATLRLAATAVGAYLYEAHQKIGLLADGLTNGSYTAAVATRELNVSVGLLQAVDKQLAAVDMTELRAEEKKN